jgi:hypothetical protein
MAVASGAQRTLQRKPLTAPRRAADKSGAAVACTALPAEWLQRLREADLGDRALVGALAGALAGGVTNGALVRGYGRRKGHS